MNPDYSKKMQKERKAVNLHYRIT